LIGTCRALASEMLVTLTLATPIDPKSSKTGTSPADSLSTSNMTLWGFISLNNKETRLMAWTGITHSRQYGSAWQSLPAKWFIMPPRSISLPNRCKSMKRRLTGKHVKLNIPARQLLNMQQKNHKPSECAVSHNTCELEAALLYVGPVLLHRDVTSVSTLAAEAYVEKFYATSRVLHVQIHSVNIQQSPAATTTNVWHR